MYPGIGNGHVNVIFLHDAIIYLAYREQKNANKMMWIKTHLNPCFYTLIHLDYSVKMLYDLCILRYHMLASIYNRRVPDLITNRQRLWKVGWLNIDLWRCLCSKTVYHKRVSHSCWNSKYRGDRVHISERKGYWSNSITRIKHLFESTMFTFPLSICAICFIEAKPGLPLALCWPWFMLKYTFLESMSGSGL